MAKEDIHGAVKSGVCPGDEDDETIRGRGKAVENWEAGKERCLSGKGALLKAHKDKLCHCPSVPSIHHLGLL